jgi:hypothetical protein
MVNPRTAKRGGLGTATKHAIAESEEALAQKDSKETMESTRMRQYMMASYKVDDRRTEPAPKLPRLRKNWETGQIEEVLDDGTVVGVYQ